MRSPGCFMMMRGNTTTWSAFSDSAYASARRRTSGLTRTSASVNRSHSPLPSPPPHHTPCTFPHPAVRLASRQEVCPRCDRPQPFLIGSCGGGRVCANGRGKSHAVKQYRRRERDRDHGSNEGELEGVVVRQVSDERGGGHVAQQV